MKDKKSIEIRLLTIPWCTYATRFFNLHNIGRDSATPIKEGTVLFVGRAISNRSRVETGHLVFNVYKNIYCFWADSNDNIHEYLKLKEKSFSWREDIALLQSKKDEFTLEIGPEG